MRARALFIAVLLISAGAVPAVGAQQSLHSASITGTVRDPSGDVVPQAPVTLTALATSAVQTARTDDAGRFTFVGVPPGRHELRVAAPGFAPALVEFTVTLGQAIDLPVALTIGEVAARVDVSADVPLLDTRRTQAAYTVRQDEIDGLPLNGRNYLDLALLAPGVSRTVQRSTERFAETSAVPGTGISVSSQRNLANTFVVDGLSSDDDAAGLAGTFYAQDVIREFQVITSGAPALFGRAASGVVNIVTQSGGNMRRGRAYGYFRNDNLDARNALATREDPLAQQQFGGTLSGPFVPNRVFFFANAERTHLARTGVVTIAPAAIETIAATLGRSGYPSAAPATGSFDTGYDTTNVFARLDATTASGARVTGRYTFYDVASENARNVGGLNATSRGTRLDNRDQSGAMSWATFGPHRFNELRGQATRSRLGAPPNDPAGPAVNIAGVASFGTSTTSPTARALDMFELGDSLTLDRGAHIVTTGGNLVHERLSIGFPGALQGLYTFQSLAAFTEGRYVNYQQAFGRDTQFQTNTNASVFVQDEWRVRSAVTVSAGLRYDVQRLADPIQTDTNNLAPRLGVAVASRDGRTVVRGAAGLHFDRIPLRAVSNALQRNGLDYQVAQLSFGQAGAPVFPQVLPAFPAGLLSNVTTIDPRIQNGAGRQFDVQVERQVGHGITAEVSYVYLNSRRIIMSRNVNVPTLSAAEAAARNVPNLGRPDPTVANNGQFQSIGSADQDGLTLSLRQDGTPWGSHRAAYTLSKAYDDAGNAFFNSPQDNFDVAADYGRSDNDQRHRLVLSGMAPAFQNFSVSYVFAAASAPPFNIVTGTDRNGDTTVNDRPAGVARNTGVGFASATLDVRISHRLRVGAHSLELSIDGFNVLNRANYLIPNNVFGTGLVPPAAFGRPTAAADPRQVQLGARWSF
jgi:hypothetical protein